MLVPSGERVLTGCLFFRHYEDWTACKGTKLEQVLSPVDRKFISRTIKLTLQGPRAKAGTHLNAGSASVQDDGFALDVTQSYPSPTFQRSARARYITHEAALVHQLS